MKGKYAYWWCELHQCGSFSFNNLSRHEMPFCDIQKDYRYLHKPSTIGGYKGDVSRKYYKDWDEYCVMLQHKKLRPSMWKKQIEANEENVDYNKKRFQDFVNRL